MLFSNSLSKMCTYFPCISLCSVHIIGVVICLINSKYKQHKPILTPFGGVFLKEMDNYTQ